MKTFKSVVRSLFQDIVGTDNKLLFFSWCTAVFLVLTLGVVLSSESVSILGVAESREYQVNFSDSVEIKHVHVIPSQIVKKGDLLLELGQSDLDLQLRVLRSKYDKLIAEMKLRKQLSELARDKVYLSEGADPLQVDITDTKREIDLIENRLRNLYVFAEVDGAVGAVNFKSGEKAPAFAPLLTLLPINPSYVNGYVNENLRSTIKVGQIVEVSSSGGKTVQGRVVSVGSRIVQIPDRLLRIQTLPAWGREVTVKIPTENEFLLGERVSVQKSWGVTLFSTAQADESEKSWDAASVTMDIQIPMNITDQFHPEISGIVYLAELRKFALISDDYPDDRPMIMLMDENGAIQEQMLPISGLEHMEDIESISAANDNIYLLSSLSATKKEKLKRERQLFVKVARKGMQFELVEEVDLRKALLSALEKSSDPVLREIAGRSLGTKKDDLEVEAHSVKDGDLYLALKRPILIENQGLILKIKNFDRIFGKGKIAPADVSVASQFSMKLPQKNNGLYLTDLVLEGDDMFISTSCRGAKCSAVWRIPKGFETAELLQEFDVDKLEGLAMHPGRRQLYGVFDNKKSGKFVSIPYVGKRAL
ncbi:HlyD family efflux transporter periplasmic adaptor subunit [Bdellovibrio sp. 22V]|uniref:HlyD family secretion protein n=1 Tax=Bdellovibrio TaxID=958 RepID=UPI00254321B6|nr:HlyD family efflux transporter periplasmic adaptor subunit [Bdellovibrio sp. 22V]WII73168.1 HlyD family efflux transporter periplasmic adaptor subunit [Bdellovibrio sp. 22V]